jgi:HD-like signal output (HDOD) protein
MNVAEVKLPMRVVFVDDDVNLLGAMRRALVNSAFFGARRQVTSVDRVLAYLGWDTLTALAVGHGLFKSIGTKATGIRWEHSLSTAMAARSIALSEHLPAPRVEEAFLTGTLHDVGRVVYASQIGQTSAKGGVLTPAQFADIDNQTSVNEHHVEVGVYLLGLWTFPSQIVAAVALRDTPSRRADSGLDLTVLAHVADRLTNARWDDANP